MPWQTKSRSQQGLQTEASLIKKKGGRSHPRSGAGQIKWDGSTEDELIEVKDANKCISLKGDYLLSLFKDAAMQSKEAVFIVRFLEAGIVMEARIRRDG